MIGDGRGGEGVEQEGRRAPEKQLERSEQPLKRWHKQELCEERRNILRRRDVFFFLWSLVLLQVNTTFLSCQVTECCYERVGPVFLPRNLWAAGRSSMNISLRVCVTRWISTSPKGTSKFKARRFITRTSIHLADLPSAVLKNYRRPGSSF